MVDAPQQDLRDEVRALRQSIEALTRRVVALEATVGRDATTPAVDRAPSATAPVDAATPAPEPAPAHTETVTTGLVLSAASRTVTYLGRLLLVLGGAYLLRSFTEGQESTNAQLLGVGLGLTYAFVWILTAWRALTKDATEAATWHAVAATMIAYPLIWETTVRLGLVPPPIGAVLLLVGTIVGLVLAWRHDARVIAWLFVLGASLSALGAIVADASTSAPYTAGLVLLGAVALWVGRARAWPALVLFSALSADLAVLMTEHRALRIGQPAPEVALVLAVALLLVYVGSITFYVLRRWWRLGLVDVIQTALAIAVGLGGALTVSQEADLCTGALCASLLVIGAVLYLLAFGVLGRDRRRCFYYVTSVALVLVLVASATLLPQPAWPWALLSIALVLAARRLGRMTLGIHAAIYSTAAAVASGVFHYAQQQWLAPASEATPTPSLVAWLALAALALSAALRAPYRSLRMQRVTEAVQVLLCALTAWALGAVLVDVLRPLLPTVDGAPDAAWLTTLRTGVLALLTVAAAGAVHLPALAVAWVLVPVLLGLGALRLLLDDLPHGRPSTLAASFMLYGVALLAATRLVRSARRQAAGADAAASDADPDDGATPPEGELDR